MNGKNWELTTWFRITAWRKLAEAVNRNLEKGLQMSIEGALRDDASDGSQNRASGRGTMLLRYAGKTGPIGGHGPHRQVPSPTALGRKLGGQWGEHPWVSRRLRDTRRATLFYSILD